MVCAHKRTTAGRHHDECSVGSVMCARGQRRAAHSRGVRGNARRRGRRPSAHRENVSHGLNDRACVRLKMRGDGAHPVKFQRLHGVFHPVFICVSSAYLPTIRKARNIYEAVRRWRSPDALMRSPRGRCDRRLLIAAVSPLTYPGIWRVRSLSVSTSFFDASDLNL